MRWLWSACHQRRAPWSIAERFHTLPWIVEKAPIETVLRWVAALDVEGEVLSERAGLSPDEQIHWMDDDEDEWANAD